MSFSIAAPESSGNVSRGIGAHATGRGPRSSGERPGSACSVGLVSSQTSGTSVNPIRIDPVASRLQRMRRRVLTGARLHADQVSKWRPAMLTLTYRAGIEWDRRHVSACVRHVRQWLKRRLVSLRYVWVAEIQEVRKAKQPEFHCVHYHLVVWLPVGVRLPMLDLRGWWPHGMTKMEWARCAVGYVSKYVSKGGDGMNLPAGARMYGVGGLEGEALAEARWWALPGWLRSEVELGQAVRRRVGGGWFDVETGKAFSSPWRVVFRGGSVWIEPRGEDDESPEVAEEFPEWFIAAIEVGMSDERILEFALLHGHDLGLFLPDAPTARGDSDAAMAV